MNKRILITGAAGFIGRKVASALSGRKYDLHLMVRPGTNIRKLGSAAAKAEIIEADLAQPKKLRDKLKQSKFEAIIHIGAIRNRPHTANEEYQKANVQSTEQLMIKACECEAKFIYFSSVGVFGTVPETLPAGNNSRRISDNHYHKSKNQCEQLINHYILYGLRSAIIRPTITYGSGDFGFPYSLIDLIAGKKLLLPKPAPDIHLGNVELLVQAVQKLLESDFKPGSTYNIGDSSAVNLLDLADFINKEIFKKPFNRKKVIPLWWFRTGETIFKIVGCTTWEQRFMLLNRSWYYNVAEAYYELNLKNTETIPGIRSTIEWYLKRKKHKS